MPMTWLPVLAVIMTMMIMIVMMSIVTIKTINIDRQDQINSLFITQLYRVPSTPLLNQVTICLVENYYKKKEREMYSTSRAIVTSGLRVVP